MNREQFLAQLRKALGNMPDAEKQDILYDYEEHFVIGLSEGKSEEEIAQSLGDPRIIGSSYRIEALVDRSREEGGISIAAVLGVVFASVSLTVFNVVFVLGPFFGLVGLMCGLWAVAVSLLLAGVRITFSPIWPAFPQLITNHALNSTFEIFLGIGVGALGLLALIGMLKLTQGFLILAAAYVKLNARLVRAVYRRN